MAFRSRDGLDAWLRLHDLFPSAHAQGEESEKEGGGPKAAAPAVVHHICVVGSRVRFWCCALLIHGVHTALPLTDAHTCIRPQKQIRRRKQGEEPDSLWRRLLLGEGDEDEAVVAAAAAATSSEGGEPAEGPGGAGEDKAAATTLYADTGDALVRALRYVRLFVFVVCGG